MSETTESPKPKGKSNVELIIELAEARNALAEAHGTINELNEMIQYNQYITNALQPIVDLIALWNESLGRDKEDHNPEKTIATFAKGVSMKLGLYSEWRQCMAQKYNLDLTPQTVDSDASR